MVALCEGAMNIKVYNWKPWFINQLLEAKKDVVEVKEGEDKGKFTFTGKLKFGMKVSLFLEHTWPAHKEWPVEWKYDQVLFSKALNGDVVGEAPPSPTNILYTPEDEAILTQIAERQTKKKNGKMPKKTTCSPGKGKRGGKRKIVDEENASSSSASDSEKTLSTDLDAGARAADEEQTEAPGLNAQKIGALDMDDDVVNSPSMDVDEPIFTNLPPSPKVARQEPVAKAESIDRDLTFAREEIKKFFGKFPLPTHISELISKFLKYV